MILNQIKSFAVALTQFCLRKLVIYHSDTTFAFDKTANGWMLRPSSKAGRHVVVVIARQFYREYAKRYPIASRTELTQVLRLEYASEKIILHCIHPVEANQRLVQTFVLSDAAVSTIEGVCIVIPETFVLAAALDPGMAAEVNNGHTQYFISASPVSKVSHLKTALCPDANTYLLSAGLPLSTEITQIEPEQLAHFMLKGLQAAPKSTLAQDFIYWPKSIATASIDWKKVITLIAGLFLLYMSAVSVYLPVTINSRGEDIQALSADVDALLGQQELIEHNVSRYNALSEVTAKRQHIAPMWLVVFELSEKESTEITGIAQNGDDIVIRGSAPRATDVLAQLSALSFVSSARFFSPVTRSRDSEGFSIVFNLKQANSSAIGSEKGE